GKLDQCQPGVRGTALRGAGCRYGDRILQQFRTLRTLSPFRSLCRIESVILVLSCPERIAHRGGYALAPRAFGIFDPALSDLHAAATGAVMISQQPQERTGLQRRQSR